MEKIEIIHKLCGKKVELCDCNNAQVKIIHKQKSSVLNHEACEAFFAKCPFCGSGVNVFQVPEDRYGETAPFGWVVECMNMGCIFERHEKGDQSIKHLAEQWNTRA